jgi:hypothetical protein
MKQFIEDLPACLAMVLLFLFALSPVACQVHRDHAIAEALKAGADPIGVRCALADSSAATPYCAIYVHKPNKVQP